MKYEPVIGMEIHIQLKTKTKMFCSCENGFGLGKEPNINICPVCTGQPGALPVINWQAVKMVLKTALALNCQIPEFSKFDRKNYFYPDLPKGYQISQYDKPLSINGFLEIDNHKIRIRRIHLEEDTGKLVHPVGADYSLVDFNRAGVPLMELVTEPDIRSAQEAKKFCQELQLILRYLDVSDADMEKGQMRCEVNISLRELKTPTVRPLFTHSTQQNSKLKTKENELGTKVEIKNLNSFKAVERGIEYEIKRQTETLEVGEKIIQETRGWDDIKDMTVSQRTKEEAHDYRYFPEPDLPPLTELTTFNRQLSTEIPELPQPKRERFIKEYSLPISDIEILVQSKDLADYFEHVCSEFKETEEYKKPFVRPLFTHSTQEPLQKLSKLTVNYLITEIPRIAEKFQVLSCPLFTHSKLQEKITSENFAEFIILTYQGKISSSGAQIVLAEMFKTGIDPTHIIQEKDLTQVSDAKTLEKILEEAIKNNPEPVEDYKKGKEKALQFLIGKVMALTKGRANPQIVADILKRRLK